MELAISHPLSDLKFIKLLTKCHLNGNTLRWELHRSDNDQNVYEPNIIGFPFVDFKLTLTVSEIGEQHEKKTIESYVNLSRSKVGSHGCFLVKSDQISIEVSIYNSVQ